MPITVNNHALVMILIRLFRFDLRQKNSLYHSLPYPVAAPAPRTARGSEIVVTAACLCGQFSPERISRFDIRVQADGDLLAVHQNVGHGIAAGAGDDQGLAGGGRSRLFQVDGTCPWIAL